MSGNQAALDGSWLVAALLVLAFAFEFVRYVRSARYQPPARPSVTGSRLAWHRSVDASGGANLPRRPAAASFSLREARRLDGIQTVAPCRCDRCRLTPIESTAGSGTQARTRGRVDPALGRVDLEP